MFRDPRRRAVASCERKTVADVMLQACRNVIPARDIVALETSDECRSHDTSRDRDLRRTSPRISATIDSVRHQAREKNSTSLRPHESPSPRSPLHDASTRDSMSRPFRSPAEQSRALNVVRTVDRIDSIDDRDLQTRLLRRLLDRADDPMPMIERDRLIVYISVSSRLCNRRSLSAAFASSIFTS
jgi:hypothetical protein